MEKIYWSLLLVLVIAFSAAAAGKPDETRDGTTDVVTLAALGSELLTNGKFDQCATGWAFEKGGAVASGSAHVVCEGRRKYVRFYCDASTCPAMDSLYPSPAIAVGAGRKYAVSLNVLKTSGGEYKVSLGGAETNWQSTAGRVSFNITAASDANLVVYMGLGTLPRKQKIRELQIDDVSVREILCFANLTTTPWGNWENASECYQNGTMLQERSAVQYDLNRCGTFANTTVYDYRTVECTPECVPDIVNSSWSEWENVSECYPEGVLNQSRYLIQYDANGCSDYNETFYEFRLANCTPPCIPNIVNSSWSEWENLSECSLNGTYERRRYMIEYDANGCSDYNESFYEYGYGNCTPPCVPNIVDTGWGEWKDDSECFANSTKWQTRERTEYDANYCGTVENETFYEQRTVSCTPANPYGFKFLSATGTSYGPDGDCDGVNDNWETLYGFSTSDPTAPSNSVDADGDGRTDWAEGLAGTNPRVYDTFQVRMVRIEGNNIILTVNTYPGNNYTVEGKPSMTSPTWTYLAGFIGGSGATTDMSVDINSMSFFRGRAWPIQGKCYYPLTQSQYDFLNGMLDTHLNYFLSNITVSSYGMPLGAYRVGDRARFAYSNPTEWGYFLEAYIAAAERGKITGADAAARMTTMLNTLKILQDNASQNYNRLFYPYYKVLKPDYPNKGSNIFPYHDVNTKIPSMDNAHLYMSLIIVDGWARDRGYSNLSALSQSIYSRMNFSVFVHMVSGKKYSALEVYADTGLIVGGDANNYADEGGLLSMIQYISGSVNFTTFQELVAAQNNWPASWNGHYVAEAAWFNSMFTWSVRSLAGVNMAGTRYSTQSLVPDTDAHMAYGDYLGVAHPAFSDAMTQGLVGYYVPPNMNNMAPPTLSKNHVTPHALFVPFNVLKDLKSSTISRLISEINELKTDTAGYYNVGGYNFGFVVGASPYANQTGYSGIVPIDGKNIYETLSEAYTALSLFNALQGIDKKPDFSYYVGKVAARQSRVNATMAYLYPICTDADHDGFAIGGGRCGPVDCNDSDVIRNPGAIEICDDGIDNDCDGAVDLYDQDCGLDCTIPVNNMTIPYSTVLCNGTYYLPDGIRFPTGGDGIVLTCNGTVIYGAGASTNGKIGLKLDQTRRGSVRGCAFKGYTYGIKSWDCYSMAYVGNRVESNYNGIFFDNSRSSNITNNTIKNNTVNGVYIFWYGATNNLINNNQVMGNGRGIVLSEYASKARVVNNTVFGNGAGIMSHCAYGTHSSSRHTYADNTIRNNTYGFYACLATHSVFRGNLLENNSNGFYITSGVNNTAYLNNIVANTVQAYDAGTNNTWDYSGQGNYWSDNVNCTATYPPLSICSAPYVIDANSIDHYPYNHQV